MSWSLLSLTTRRRSVEAPALALLAALFGVTVYRAATQSITHDEACTYNWFLASGPQHLFDMDANNHILNTLLARAALALCGHSELSLRLPSLLGGLLCLSAFFLLTRALLPPGRWFLLGLAAVALNPFMLDFLCAARGYGLATGFMLWALLFSLQALEDEGCAAPGRKPLWLLASLALGLSLASNLAFLVVDVAIALLFIALLVAQAGRQLPLRLAPRLLGWFCLPGPLLAALLWWPVLRKAEARQFFLGTRSLRECAMQLASSSLFLAQTSISSFADNALRPESMLEGWQSGLLGALVLLLLPLSGLLLAATAGAIARRAWREGGPLRTSRLERALLLLVGVLLATLGVLVVAHHAGGLPYPVDRTGIYLIPLLTLALVTSLCWLTERRPGRRGLIEWPALGTLCLLAAVFLASFHVSYFKTWRYDAGTRAIFAVLASRHQAEPQRVLSIGGHWLYEPSINFYRQLSSRTPSGSPWLRAFVRAPQPKPSDYDFFVCNPVDFPGVDWTQYPMLYRDPVSGTTLYRNPR